MRHYIAILLTTVLAATLVTHECHCQDSSATSFEEELAAIQEVFKEKAADGFCGVLLIRHDGQTLMHEAYGFRDRQSNEPMSTEHGFDIGSIVKPITSVAILRLEQEGKLKTSDTLADFFEDVPQDKQSITVQQLLEHRAGLPDIFGSDYDVVDKPWFLDKAWECELIAEPGEQRQYSNAGYTLLACIIEKVTGKTYESYVQEQILEPAGTPRIGYIFPEWPNDQLAVGYRRQERWGTPLDHAWANDGPSWNLRGNGGMLATAEDLCKWYEALIDGKLINTGQLEKFYAYAADTSNTTGGRLLGHAGGNGIFNSLQISFIEPDFHMTLFSSVSDQQGESIWPEFREPLLKMVKMASQD